MSARSEFHDHGWGCARWWLSKAWFRRADGSLLRCKTARRLVLGNGEADRRTVEGGTEGIEGPGDIAGGWFAGRCVGWDNLGSYYRRWCWGGPTSSVVGADDRWIWMI